MGDGVCLDEVLTKEQQAIKEAIWRGSDRSENNDMVYRPPHYTQGKVECIDAIEASMTPEEFSGFLKGQVIKYIWRYEKKWDPLEDLEKTKYYLDKLIDFAKGHPDVFRKDFSLTVNPTQELVMPKHLAKSISDAMDGLDKVVVDA